MTRSVSCFVCIERAMDVHEDQDNPQERVKDGHGQQARAVLNQCA